MTYCIISRVQKFIIQDVNLKKIVNNYLTTYYLHDTVVKVLVETVVVKVQSHVARPFSFFVWGGT